VDRRLGRNAARRASAEERRILARRQAGAEVTAPKHRDVGGGKDIVRVDVAKREYAAAGKDAKLPFDDATVVSSHSAGILRRLKGEDRAALEKWLAGLAPAGAER